MFQFIFILFIAPISQAIDLSYKTNIIKMIRKSCIYNCQFKMSSLNDPIDPLENIKVSKKINPSLISSKKIDNKLDNVTKSIYIDNESLSKLVRNKNEIGLSNVTNILPILEADKLKDLPIQFYKYCINFLDQLVQRGSFISITVHLMLLIPILRYMKLELGLSIVPFIYLGPLVFIIPFAVSYLWEQDAFEFYFIDNKLKSFLVKQQTIAIDFLTDRETQSLTDITTQLNESEQNNESLYYLLNENKLADKVIVSRLLSKLDIEVFYTEIIKCKPNRYKFHYSDKFGSDNGMSQDIRPSNEYSSSDIFVDIKNNPIQRDQNNLFLATKMFLDKIKRNQSKYKVSTESIIKELKDMQSDLNNSNSSISL